MTVDFKKYPDGLVPAIIQDADTRVVLMMGFMNEGAFAQTSATKKVTFFSRSKNRLWTKGEESGNELHVQDIKVDCDADTLLIRVQPTGPVCHTGAETCWNERNVAGDFLTDLEHIIADRKVNPADGSYTSALFQQGINKVAQKVGEEAVELVIEAKDNNAELFKGEAADLLFHYLVLLQEKGLRLKDIVSVLKSRNIK